MTTTLQFPDLTQLARFKSMLNGTPFELNVADLTITCFCTKDLVQEAAIFYGAKVVKQSMQNGALQKYNRKEKQ